jgi:histidinol-phosphate aminotransferase
MKDIKTLIRPNILSLKPYSSARDEFKGKDGIFLDANENPFGNLNRYPDPYQKALKEKLSALKNIATENIFVGNGSDEVIDLAFRIFCNPGKDKVIVCPPTYGMYEVSANINDVDIISIPLDENFQLDVRKILRFRCQNDFPMFAQQPNWK